MRATVDEQGKRVIHLKLSARVIKLVDLWAVEHDMFRNKAVEVLLERAVSPRRYQNARSRSRARIDP